MLHLLLISSVFCAKILLQDIQALTFRSDKQTTGRRTSPIPQLQCIKNCRNAPSVVQCVNVGWDGHDVQWKCTAELSDNQKFKNIEVVCEGYSYRDDPYVLVGSCGLEYSLENFKSHFDYYQPRSDSFFENGLRIILYIVVAIILLTFFGCIRFTRRFDDYSNVGDGGSGNGGSGPSHYKFYRRNEETIRPGFWSGLFAGGALGHLFTRRAREREFYQRNEPSFATYTRTGTSAGYGGTRRREENSNNGSTSSATGYGGTRRR